MPVQAGSDFPIQNLPFGLACIDHVEEAVVVAIGDQVLDLTALAAEGLLPEEDFPILHCFIDVDKNDLRVLRMLVYDLLREDNSTLRDNMALRKAAFHPISEVEMMVPVEIPSFVDFYAGIYHAGNVGKMFRPDMDPLLPNYRHLPVGYNGRASTVIPSGAPISRPKGQYRPKGVENPVFGPTQELDFELELGFFISDGNEMGEAISVARAEEHILGLVLVNDWSARDIQRWEYQPLGPFLGKSFATSISPWIVTMEALEPFRIEGPKQQPEPLEHLLAAGPAHYDINLEVALRTPSMRQPQVIARSNAKHLYWSIAQMVAHQTSNGTAIEPGDLVATGTISGPDPGSFGSLLELSWNGSKPLRMQETGEERTYLQDGDTLTMRGWCEGHGIRIGFGSLETMIGAVS